MTDQRALRLDPMPGFEIAPYEHDMRQAVIDFVLPIQRDEFGVDVSLEDQPDLDDPAGYFQNGAGNFWVARARSQIIGTIGVLDISNHQLALKKMFVETRWRGSRFGVAASLLNVAIDWARTHGAGDIFLGSTPVMTRAHRFYQKHGFVPHDKSALPDAFPIVPVDRKFFHLSI